MGSRVPAEHTAVIPSAVMFKRDMAMSTFRECYTTIVVSRFSGETMVCLCSRQFAAKAAGFMRDRHAIPHVK